jgi:5-formyltetrahydrofolate cyclo-ligase
MDSIGSGELLVILVVGLLAIDPRTAGRWWSKFRKVQRRLMDVREDFEREVRSTVETEPARRESVQSRLRSWSRERVMALGQTEWDRASGQILSRLRSLEDYGSATDVAAFWPLAFEIPLRPVLEGILADGKRLWMPWLDAEPGVMDMAPVSDLETDLAEGKFRTREPKAELRGRRFPEAGLVLVPGEVFDLHGARIGKGGGYYDRWLALKPLVKKVGIAWDAQVHPGKLPQSAHDQQMNVLLTEVRLVNFAPLGAIPPVVVDGSPMISVEESNA